MAGSSRAEKSRPLSDSETGADFSSISVRRLRIFSKCSFIFSWTSHEFASLECGYVCRVQLKPFTVLSFRCKSIVPVGFNPLRIICANRVYGVWFLGKLDG